MTKNKKHIKKFQIWSNFILGSEYPKPEDKSSTDEHKS